MSEKKLPAPPFPAEHMPRTMMMSKQSKQAHNPPDPPKPLPKVSNENASEPAPKPAHTEPEKPIKPIPAVEPPKSAEPIAEKFPVPPTAPPLFVKVDKYQEIISSIQKLKSYSLGLRDALDALSDIEKELQNGMSVINRALDSFNSIIAMLDSKLLRIQGVERTTAEIPKEMDEYVRDVHDQMEKIRHDIKSI